LIVGLHAELAARTRKRLDRSRSATVVVLAALLAGSGGGGDDRQSPPNGGDRPPEGFQTDRSTKKGDFVYLSQFGGPTPSPPTPPGPSQFNNPDGVAVDPASHDVYVVDSSNTGCSASTPRGPTSPSSAARAAGRASSFAPPMSPSTRRPTTSTSEFFN
jgi:hypothetical protein